MRGSLGLFVGTGFSMAACGPGRAPDFLNLLREVAHRLEIEWDENDARFHRRSLPQIASLLVALVAEQQAIDRLKAEEKLKEAICLISDLKPSNLSMGALLAGLDLAWVVTTNYDLVLESLLDNAESLLASQPFVARYGGLPVYHLHGHRHFPDSIRITEEDYVRMVGPLDYQRLKLPLLMLESTTLILGYALGDMNVRSAMALERIS
jgi:hypothetical protein